MSGSGSFFPFLVQGVQIHRVGVTPSLCCLRVHPPIDVDVDSGVLLLSLPKDRFEEAFDGTTASSSAGLLLDCCVDDDDGRTPPRLVDRIARLDDIIRSRLLWDRGREDEAASSDSSYGGRRVLLFPFPVFGLVVVLSRECSFGGTGGGNRRFLRQRRKKNSPIMLTTRIPAMAEPIPIPIAAPVLTPSDLVSG